MNKICDLTFEQCERCQKRYIQSYWDSEIEWFIEINVTGFCKQCLLSEKRSTYAANFPTSE